MKKQKIQLAAMLLVLAALAAAFLGLKKYNEAQSELPAEEEGEVIIGAAYDDVVNLIYEYEGETYQYEKEEDTWYLAEDHSRNVKQYRVKAMLAGVTPLRAAQTLENVEDLSVYGLEAPQRTIIFDTAVQRFKIYVGDANSLTSSYYIRLEGDPDTVYIVAQADINRFNYGLEDILEAEEEPEEGTASGDGAGGEADGQDMEEESGN